MKSLQKKAFFIPMITGVMLSSSADRASAVITWNLTYGDSSTGLGFYDSTLGATRRGTFEAALAYVNSVLDASGTVDLNIKTSESDGSGFLASAGSLYFTGPDGFANGLVFEHATTGTDPLPGDPDGEVTFDFGYTWNSDLDTPTSGEYDLFTVSLHEITHALGFSSLLNLDGTSGINGRNPGVFSIFDSFLEDGSGASLFASGGNFIGNISDLTSDNLFFGGPNAKVANSGNPVQIFAPGSFAEGSSLSHVQASTLMNYAIAPGVERRTYSAQEIGILKDIGYSISAIPEISTLSSGFLLLIGVTRRRREPQCV